MATGEIFNAAAAFKPGFHTLVELSDGTLLNAQESTATGDIIFYHSTDGGVNWSATTGAITDNDATSDEDFSVAVSSNDRIFVLYAVTSTRYAKFRSGSFSSGTITWDSTGRDFTNKALEWGCDAVVYNDGTDDYAIGITTDNASPDKTEYVIGKRTSGGTWSDYDKGTLDSVSTSQAYGKVAFAHTGDGVTGKASPHAFYAWATSTNVKWEKRAYSSGPTWASSGTTRTIASTGGLSPIDMAFDGTRCVITVNDGGNVEVYERDEGDTATTDRSSGVPTFTAVSGSTVGIIIHPNEDFTLVAIDNSDSDPKYVTYDRSADSWGSWTLVGNYTLSAEGTNGMVLSTVRNSDTNGLLRVYDNTAFDLDYWELDLSFNEAPTQPTWNNTDNVAADVDEQLVLDWNFQDPDVGDTQSAYTVRRKLGSGGTWNYWNGSTWQASEDGTTKITSGTESLTLSASWGADGDAQHYYGTKLWDAADAGPSPWSADLRVTPSAQDNPALSAPADAGTIGANPTVTWTVGGGGTQSQYRVVVSDTSSTSNLTAGTLSYDSGWVVDGVTMSITATGGGDTNSATRYVRVQTKNDEGLLSDIDQHTVTVTFTPPATPTASVDDGTSNAGNPTGAITITCTDPGTGSTVDYHDVYRRVQSEGGDGIRIATGIAVDGSTVDYTPAAGVTYEYKVVSVGTNGSTAEGAWTA